MLIPSTIMIMRATMPYIQITTLQFFDKVTTFPQASKWGCNCKFVATSGYNSTTVQASAKVTTEGK